MIRKARAVHPVHVQKNVIDFASRKLGSQPCNILPNIGERSECRNIQSSRPAETTGSLRESREESEKKLRAHDEESAEEKISSGIEETEPNLHHAEDENEFDPVGRCLKGAEGAVLETEDIALCPSSDLRQDVWPPLVKHLRLWYRDNRFAPLLYRETTGPLHLETKLHVLTPSRLWIRAVEPNLVVRSSRYAHVGGNSPRRVLELQRN